VPKKNPALQKKTLEEGGFNFYIQGRRKKTFIFVKRGKPVVFLHP